MPCNSTGKMYTSTLIVILEGTIQKINSFSVILFDKKPPLQESRFCARTHASPHADDPHLFLFLLITDDPCLVLNFLTGGTLCQGAYIGTQQFVRPRRTISPWPCCFWSSPSLRGPWRALVFLVVSTSQTVQSHGSVGLIGDLLFLN